MARFVQGWERVAELRRRSGTGAVVRRLGYRFARRLVDVSVAHVLWLDVDRVHPSLRPPSGYTFRFLSTEEVRAHSADSGNWLSPAMAGRIAGGLDFCFAALAGPRLAAYGWFALECIEPEHNGGTALSYPSDMAYMYGGFTYPEFRGNRLHGLVKKRGLEALGEHGVRGLVSTVEWTNEASLRSNFRLGCLDLGRAVELRLGRFGVARYPRAAQRRGIRFAKDAMTRPASRR